MQWTKWAFMIFYVTPCYSCEFCHIFKVVLVCVLWFCCASRLNDMNIYLVFWPYTSRPTSLLNTNRDMEFFFCFHPVKTHSVHRNLVRSIHFQCFLVFLDVSVERLLDPHRTSSRRPTPCQVSMTSYAVFSAGNHQQSYHAVVTMVEISAY
jgi:hypothetical protein